jgi:uncharacterized membrane protein
MPNALHSLARRLAQEAEPERGRATGPAFDAAERTVEQAVQWLRLIIESTGAVIIAIGVVIAAATFVRALRRQRDPAYAAEGYNGVRLTLARYLALALEFQLGADILSTAVAPTWTAIGKLGAIAVIRTALNYFLGLEMREETARVALGDAPERRDAADRAAGPGATGVA